MKALPHQQIHPRPPLPTLPKKKELPEWFPLRGLRLQGEQCQDQRMAIAKLYAYRRSVKKTPKMLIDNVT
jgi:hypothetical protein